ncbi:MAG: hypothetical protein GY866_17685 [Proteobacteria bacterium]|nr:hypothetical protein [Pseudomonadota bacterium]
MDTAKLYEELSLVVKRAGGAIPVFQTEELYNLLKDLVSEEEAALAIEMPRELISPDALAEKTGRPLEEVAEKLETMTNNGFLHAIKNPDGSYRYNIMPLLPGIFEAQFMKGTKTERDYLIAKRFRAYLDMLNELRESLDKPMPAPKLSYFRVLPVEEEVKAGSTVLPFAELSKYLEKTSAIAVGTCFCRHFAILNDENDRCGASLDNCMGFGDAATFMSERHNARLVDKKEALAILKQAEEQGLVHCSANTSEELTFICNCCTCHCGILSQAKSISHASLMLTSGYFARVQEELCTACETCLERCPVTAIGIDEFAVVDKHQCIGCGLCVGGCPDEAIALKVDQENKLPPATLGRLEKAIKVARAS